jgi:hypothetical protein
MAMSISLHKLVLYQEWGEMASIPGVPRGLHEPGVWLEGIGQMAGLDGI